MAVYSADKLIAEARRLASEYRKTTGRPLAGVSNEVAIHDAAHLLDLEVVKDNSVGYDAVGRGPRDGLRIQIKGRTIYDERKRGQRIGQLKTDREWDRVVLVLLNEEFEPYEIYEADRDDIVSALTEVDNAKRKRRGAMSVAKFKILSRLVWTPQDGVEQDEIWANR